MPVTVAGGAKARGFAGIAITKAGGERVGYVPAPYERGRERRWTVKRARSWAREHGLQRVFIDSRRRNGTTYWKEMRL